MTRVACAPLTRRLSPTLGTGRVVMGNARLKDYIKIDRREGSACYIIFCQRCETITYGVGTRGYMYFKEVTRLARKHRCE